MKNALTLRQLCAFCLLAVSAPALTVCAAMPWPGVLAVSAVTAAFLTLCVRLWRRTEGTGLAVLMLRVFGRPAGTAVLLGEGLFAVVLLWRFAAGTDTAFPDAPTIPFVPLCLLIAAAWAAWQGRRACVRGICVLFFFGAALLIALALFALPDVQPSRLLSPPGDVSVVPSAVLLLPVYGLFLAEPNQNPGAARWLPAFLLLPPAAAALCAAVPGAGGSLYTMAKSVEVLSVARRMEPLVSAALTAGWFAALLLVILAFGEMAAALGSSRRWWALAAGLLAVPGALWRIPVPDVILLLGAVVFCGIFPLLTLLLVALKNNAQNREKGVDKGGAG